MYTIDKPTADEFPQLLHVWEASVRATHHFLREEDILFFKHIIQSHSVFAQVNLTCARDGEGIVGFLGVANKNLEMLFLHPRAIGKGVGKMLMRIALQELGVTHVDVNEQNVRAREFYEHFGFQTISRSALDGTGKPFPILHMELKAKPVE
ncbi:MAG: GNAT family N-acetyltransferase [Bacteroidota bacterium]